MVLAAQQLTNLNVANNNNNNNNNNASNTSSSAGSMTMTLPVGAAGGIVTVDSTALAVEHTAKVCMVKYDVASRGGKLFNHHPDNLYIAV